MLIVAGEVKLSSAAQVEEGREAVQAMVAATVQEAGCITYCFAQDLVDPSIIRIFERWESQAALDAHIASPHMATFLAAVGSMDVVNVDTKLYDATNEREVRP